MKLKGIKLEGTYKIRYYATSFEIYNEKDNMIYYEENNGYWSKRKYDEKDNVIYFEDSNVYWSKRKYDEKDNMIYFEDSDGIITDKRVKELTIEEVEELFGYKIKIKGERK